MLTILNFFLQFLSIFSLIKSTFTRKKRFINIKDGNLMRGNAELIMRGNGDKKNRVFRVLMITFIRSFLHDI